MSIFAYKTLFLTLKPYCTPRVQPARAAQHSRSIALAGTAARTQMVAVKSGAGGGKRGRVEDEQRVFKIVSARNRVLHLCGRRLGGVRDSAP